MSGPFVKLYGSILDSSVWSEDPYTRLVWITMLAMADADGFVEAAVPGLARRANVPLEACEAALLRLQAPDPYSKSPEHEGRRIERAERGWNILNYTAYRELRTERQVRNAEYQKKHRLTSKTSKTESAKGSASLSASVNPLEGGMGGERKLPGNPLLAGKRPDLEREGYALIRKINEHEPDREPWDILIEASGWETKDGRVKSKLRLETMTDDHLIRTVKDLRSILALLEGKDGQASRR